MIGIILQAIDLIDEAGSRARIQAFMARQGTGGNAAVQRQPWEELAQVMEAKTIAIQVSEGIPGQATFTWLGGSVHSEVVETLLRRGMGGYLVIRPVCTCLLKRR